MPQALGIGKTSLLFRLESEHPAFLVGQLLADPLRCAHECLAISVHAKQSRNAVGKRLPARSHEYERRGWTRHSRNGKCGKAGSDLQTLQPVVDALCDGCSR